MSDNKRFRDHDNGDLIIRCLGNFAKVWCDFLIRDADDVTANDFVMPGLTPPTQQGSNFTFDLNSMESGAASDEWMTMDSYGTWW